MLRLTGDHPMVGDFDADWTEIAGAGLLADLFGGWPSFRDAEIRSIEIERSSDSVSIVVDYQDRIEDDANEGIKARIRFVWTEVEELRISISDSWLGGIEFKRDGNRSLTLLDQRNGTDGRILARFVEASIVQLEAASDDTEEFPTISLNYR